MITLIFSMLGPRLDDAQADQFSAFAQWVVLNEREGRILVDGIGAQADITRALSALTAMGRDPRVIGAWHEDGSRVEGFDIDHAAWCAVAPDLVDRTDPENPVYYRPTQFSETHRWAGWGRKQ